MTTSTQGDAPFKMQCVDRKRRRSRSPKRERLPEEVGDRLGELLPEEALEEAVRGLTPEELTGRAGLLTQLAGRVIIPGPRAVQRVFEITGVIDHLPFVAVDGGASSRSVSRWIGVFVG